MNDDTSKRAKLIDSLLDSLEAALDLIQGLCDDGEDAKVISLCGLVATPIENALMAMKNEQKFSDEQKVRFHAARRRMTG